jgi:prophage antirepressor-like protein
MSKTKSDFFMSIFNKILKINDNEIILIFDKDNNIWFGLRDIIHVLGYTSYDKTIATIKISLKNKSTFDKLSATKTYFNMKRQKFKNLRFLNFCPYPIRKC